MQQDQIWILKPDKDHTTERDKKYKYKWVVTFYSFDECWQVIRHVNDNVHKSEHYIMVKMGNPAVFVQTSGCNEIQGN